MPELPDVAAYIGALESRILGQVLERIPYGDNETNYCAHCQTGGALLADRSLSRLLKKDWPRTLAELDALKRR